jgi:hypothetical protein
MWFGDTDDATNWFMYQKLSYFGGMTAEQVLAEDAFRGYNALVQYANEKEQHKL